MVEEEWPKTHLEQIDGDVADIAAHRSSNHPLRLPPSDVSSAFFVGSFDLLIGKINHIQS